MLKAVSIILTASLACGAIDLLLPHSWSAFDGLGREIQPLVSSPKPEKKRDVAIFYWTWHYHFAERCQVRNASEILAKHPDALHDTKHEAWGNTPFGTPHYWGKPIWGYYVDTDEYVIRKHAELLACAGIDAIFFDCTNLTQTWKEGYETVFKVFEQARKDGINPPKVAFMLNFSPNQNTAVELRQLYEDIYSKGRYKELWYAWDGKPVIMAHKKALDEASELDRQILDFFCFKQNEPSYFAKDTRLDQHVWGWCSTFPQTRFGVKPDGGTEEVTVSVAQNASKHGLVAMNDIRGGVQGRAYTKGDFSYTCRINGKETVVDGTAKDAFLYGLNFQQQWDRAHQLDPDLVFVTGWNEWLAGRFEIWQNSPNAFPDQFSPEFSRDIEPHDGILKDHFYWQLVHNVRKFKGLLSQPQKTRAVATIELGKGIEQWNGIAPNYVAIPNSTSRRNSKGWRGEPDFVSPEAEILLVDCKVAYDKTHIAFLVRAKQAFPSPKPGWIALFIDADSSRTQPHWEGFTHVVKLWNPQDSTAVVEKSTGGWNFAAAGQGEFSVKGDILQLKVPIVSIFPQSLQGDPQFDFKWHSGNPLDGDPMHFYTAGNAAPPARFRFVFNPQGSAE